MKRSATLGAACTAAIFALVVPLAGQVSFTAPTPLSVDAPAGWLIRTAGQETRGDAKDGRRSWTFEAKAPVRRNSTPSASRSALNATAGRRP